MQWIKAHNRILKLENIKEFTYFQATDNKWCIFANLQDGQLCKLNTFDEECDAITCFNFLWSDLTKKVS